MSGKIQGELFVVGGEEDVLFSSGYPRTAFMREHKIGEVADPRGIHIEHLDNPRVKNLSCSKERVSFSVRRTPEIRNVPRRDSQGNHLKNELHHGLYDKVEEFPAVHDVNFEWYHHVFNNKVVL